MSSINYQRKVGDGAQDKYTWEFINRNPIIDLAALEPIEGAVVAAGNSLPQVSSTVQEYRPFVRTASPTMVACAGVIQKFGDTFAILVTDTPNGETGTWATKGRFRVQLASGATAAVGADAYIAASDMLVSEDSTGREYLGFFVSVNEVNPDAGPDATYAIVQLKQTEK